MTKAKILLSKSLFVLLVCAIVTGLYLSYFFTIGVPKTQARNFYNFALEEEKEGNNEKALELLNLAKKAWDEEYISQEIAKLSN